MNGRARTSALNTAELQAWLRLLLTDGVGRSTARRLLAAFGGPTEVFAASPAARLQVAGPAAMSLDAEPDNMAQHLAVTQAWLAGGPGRTLWTLGDTDYPTALLEAADPPLALFADGDPACLRRPMLAIVGSRHATGQGLDHARAFARSFSDAGWAVVSGLAAGIDGAAHEGALAGPGGTVAIIGTGPDQVYPARHRSLAQRIRAHGLILSEYLPGTPPLAPNFPRRNRLIAGLSRGTLVVEAALQSGSLITARMAVDAGREVFAIPGSIHSPLARGCHALIRQGAKLVESAADILEEFPPPAGTTRRTGAATNSSRSTGVSADDDPSEDPLLRALGHDPVTLDALGARTGRSVVDLQVGLLELELTGQVARLPGGLFQRRAGV